MEKYRELNFLRCKRIFEYDFLRVDDMLRSPLKVLGLVTCLGTYDWSLATKVLLHMLVSRRHRRGEERRWLSLPGTPEVALCGGPGGGKDTEMA